MKKIIKKLTVTIGIPTYNEENNIKYLLDALSEQKQIDYLFKQILIYIDGSTDNTERIARTYKNKLIKVITGRKREGQQKAQNTLLEEYESDIIVFIEADTLPFNEYTINELIRPFTMKNTQNLGMTVGNCYGILPRTFFERVSTYGDFLKKEITGSWHGGNNIYNSTGHAMKALSREFANQLRWPSNVPEDSYAYLRLKELDMKMLKQNHAKTVKRNVVHLNDSIKQSSKFTTGKKALKEYFADEIVEKEFSIPKKILIKHTLLSILRNPFFTVFCILQVLINRSFSLRNLKFNELYVPYSSTKNLRTEYEKNN